ncbi:MAG TPA: phosphoglucomutase/phosphomannomutase family protein [Anaerolineales bacterium]|nr:phosphoglucomutase/phosphomannomutase family protein [Anaerolineales bacterium]
MSITFGTDGWRAVISEDFTFDNVRRVAQAIASVATTPEWFDVPMPSAQADLFVVGYDTRFLSAEYAAEVARVLGGQGLRVLLAERAAPTPAVSFAIPHYRAAGGVMITASHNPAKYNGIKVKAAFGGSASDKQARRIEAHLSDSPVQNLPKFADLLQRGKIEYFDPAPAYLAHLQTLIDFNLLANFAPKLNVLADSMFGAGMGYFANILQPLGIAVSEIRGEVNPSFGGGAPEPIERYLIATRQALSARPGHFALITDGDADRIGAMDENGNFVDPHKIMTLCLRDLVERKNQRGAIVKTVSTTQMLNRQAREYGLPIHETPVGFNYIADYMMRTPVVIGGEESGGISLLGHIPEGDGILMGLAILCAMAARQSSLQALVADVLAVFGPAFYTRRDLRLAQPIAKKEMVKRLSEQAPTAIAGLTVHTVSTFDGVKYLMEDDSWLLIRPSGTEPVLRVYAEGKSPTIVAGLMAYGETLAAG